MRIIVALILLLGAGSAAADPAAPKPATAATRAANARVVERLPFHDRQDFADARRGFIAAPETLTIRDGEGRIVWDLEPMKAFLGGDAPPPDTVNPSLWRQAQLNLVHGLFEVVPGIWQVRGYDISNISFVAGKTGWIVIDPLVSAETAAAAYELVSQHLGRRPVVAIIYSHSHVDHYGGARGLVAEADVKAGRVPILAPQGFLEHAVAENLIAGNAMGRRATYMFGTFLPRGARGYVGSGLGIATSAGTIGLLPPTDLIRETGEERILDGVRIVFQMTPGTEAPAEMNSWFPERRALWMAENANHTLHNVLTLRGALVRDALVWAEKLDETLMLWGDKADVSFASHHWPTWGNDAVRQHLEGQRDLMKALHDQSVRLMNEGLTGPEIAEAIAIPDAISKRWANRGYYGSLKHNARAVYQRYMGWYDGNPASLDSHPPVEAARRTIRYMGGGAAVLRKARADFEAGDYRWTAEVLSRLVLAEPGNREAALLLADSLEQLGYQAESGPWRSIYLSGAKELREGIPAELAAARSSPDMLAALPPAELFRLLAVRIDGHANAAVDASFNLVFPDLRETWSLALRRGVLVARARPLERADATLTIPRAVLTGLLAGERPLASLIADGSARLEGDPSAIAAILGAVRAPSPRFPLVTRPPLPEEVARP